MSDPSQDIALLEQVKTGDVGAFETLFHKYQPILFRRLLFLTRKPDISHDLVQETFIRVWQNRQSLKPSLSFLAYLFRISGNLIRDDARYRKTRERLGGQISPPALSEGDDPEEALHLRQLQVRLAEVINEKLSERCRLVLLLSRFEKKSNREIGALLGISEKTVENQIHHALKILKRELGS